MPSVTLYIATSLDGFIARPDGGIEWLAPYEGLEEDYGYSAFYDSIDTLIMGRKTYEQALGFGKWPYPGKTTYVFSHQPLRTRQKDVILVSDQVGRVLMDIHSRGGNEVWLVGGAQLTASLRRQGLIDKYIVSTIPVLLGEGIPLFYPVLKEAALKLIEIKSYPNGIVQAHYVRKTHA